MQFLIVVPTSNNRAVFHITDIKFGSSTTNSTLKNAQGTKGYAANILGVAEHLDIQKVFDVQYVKSKRIKTHMQRDNLIVDFGYMTSAGKIFL